MADNELTPREALAQLLAGGEQGAAAAQLATPEEPPSIRVDGLGDLAYPVTPARIRRLRELGYPAKYGKGELTLTDPTVRSTWQLPTEAVHVDWHGRLDDVLGAAVRQLGLPDGSRLRAELHSMLLYEKGQFFLPHQDSEKNDAMVATMVVMLPSSYTGGELVIHDGEAVSSFSGSRDAVSVVAFYADRLHEVQPVRTGNRITLTYNLLLDGAPSASAEGVDTESVTELATLISRHFTTLPPQRYTHQEVKLPVRLAYLLDHQYTERGLSWTHLKGVDTERVTLLRAAADQAGCDAVLALCEIREVWSTLDDDRDDWSNDDSPDIRSRPDGTRLIEADGHGLTFLVDDDVTITRWTDVEGQATQTALRLNDEQICASTPTVSMPSYDSQYEGYMGNYGNTLDRWYRRAAVLLWPRALAFANRAEASPAAALDDLLLRLQSADADTAAAAASQIDTITSFWPYAVHVSKERDVLLGKAFQAAVRVADAARAQILLSPFRIADLQHQHMVPLTDLAERHGGSWIEALIGDWLRGTQADTRDFEQWLPTLPDLCRALPPGLPATAVVTGQLLNRSWTTFLSMVDLSHYRSPVSAVRERLQELGSALAAILEAAALANAVGLRDRIVDACRQRPDLSVSALSALHTATGLPADVRTAGGFDELARHAAGQLRTGLDVPPRDADDWSITPPGDCSCALCGRLAEFLVDRSQTELDWPLAKDGREHLHKVIDRAELPVTHQTRRTGRPFTLMLRKTTDLFAQERAARRRDRQDLERLIADRPAAR